MTQYLCTAFLHQGDLVSVVASASSCLGSTEKLISPLELGIRGGNISSFADLGAPMAGLLLRLMEQKMDREYADYIDPILAAIPERAHTDKKHENVLVSTGDKSTDILLIEPLTKHELQVLKLMATDLSTQEIATKLVISTATF